MHITPPKTVEFNKLMVRNGIVTAPGTATPGRRYLAVSAGLVYREPLWAVRQLTDRRTGVGGRSYRPEVIEWVRRTTATQGIPEHVPGEVFHTRPAALFGVSNTTTIAKHEGDGTRYGPSLEQPRSSDLPASNTTPR